MRKTRLSVSQALTTSEKLMEKIMEFEGLRLEAYRDAAGVLTIGYGHTRDVKEGDRISEYWARELLKEDIGRAAQLVLRLGVCRTQGQLDALVSFTFNLGFQRLRKSTLLRAVKRQEPAAVIRREFMRWVWAGGQRLKGLERRREWEADRFLEAYPQPLPTGGERE